MKIAYILDEDISVESGVVKKIKNQIEEWKDRGFDVIVVSLRSFSLDTAIANSHIVSIYNKEISVFRKFINHYYNIKKLNSILKEFKPDLIYCRYMRYSPNLVKTLKGNAKYIVEINTDDINEFKLGSKSVYLLNKFTRGFFFGNASGYVSVSQELARKRIFLKYRKPTVIIANGYVFECHKINEDHNNTDFLFIGSPNQQWHGVDKIIYMAKRLSNYNFHIAGYTKEELKNLFKSIPENINAYGYLDQSQINELLEKCGVGISSLALHRNKMEEASPLKSRQYLSYGLPIIVGYTDTDLKEEEFVCSIGNYENNVIDNIDMIEEFCCKAIKISKKKICKKSEELLSVQNKEKRRIDFFYKVLNKTNYEL